MLVFGESTRSARIWTTAGGTPLQFGLGASQGYSLLPRAHDSLNPALSTPGIAKLWIIVRGFSLDSDRIEYAVQESYIKKHLKNLNLFSMCCLTSACPCLFKNNSVMIRELYKTIVWFSPCSFHILRLSRGFCGFILNPCSLFELPIHYARMRMRVRVCFIEINKQ